MTYKLASNLSFMFQEAPAIIDRYQLAKDSGFKAVESGFPIGYTVNQVVEAKQKANVEQVLINVFTGDTAKGELGFAALPGKEQEFKDSISLTIEYATALNCKKIHIMSGVVANPTSANDSTYLNNLKYAVGKFETLGIVGVIEPINSITVPNYYMNNYEKALEIIRTINSPSLKLQLDFFHLQQITGRITNTFEKCLPHIGHIQIAQVPDRSEPDTVGELDYQYIFSLLDKHKYSGYLGLEYKPRAGSSEGLKWLSRFGLSL